MAEKGWNSFTVRLSTAGMIRVMDKDKKISIDEILNDLISNGKNKKWLTCPFCVAKVKASNMTKYMNNTHPK